MSELNRERPRFTLLVCVHDRVEHLQRCLESLRPLQGEANGELLIACDGGAPGAKGIRVVSTGEYEGNAAMREAVGPLLDGPGWRSRWIDLPAGGPAKARNAVLPLAEGELILFLNDDIRCQPGLLRAHDAAHRRRPGHAVMGNTRWAPEVITDEFMHWVAHHDSFYYLIPTAEEATWEYFHTMNLSVDRRWFAEEGACFDEAFPDPAFEDTELGLRLWKQGLRITLAYDAVLYHVHHFTFEEYLRKARMRGRSARRFLELHPEMTDRILSEFTWQARQLEGWKGLARRLLRRLDPLELREARLAEAFLAGYREGIAGSQSIR